MNLSLILTGDVTIKSYSISYFHYNCSTDTLGEITNVTETMYTLIGLEEGTVYNITVTARLSDGVMAVETITATTMTAG